MRQVEHELTPVVDVPDVERELGVPPERVAAVDLGPAGDAWPHVVAALLLGRVAPQVPHQQRARPDQAHVAAQHVPQLRQLVDRGGAQEPAESSQALGVGQRPAVGADGVAHGAELDHRERHAAPPGPLLAEEDGPAHVGPHRRAGHRQQRAGHGERGGRADQVERALEPGRAHGPSVPGPGGACTGAARAPGFVLASGVVWPTAHRAGRGLRRCTARRRMPG